MIVFHLLILILRAILNKLGGRASYCAIRRAYRSNNRGGHTHTHIYIYVGGKLAEGQGKPREDRRSDVTMKY